MFGIVFDGHPHLTRICSRSIGKVIRFAKNIMPDPQSLRPIF